MKGKTTLLFIEMKVHVSPLQKNDKSINFDFKKIITFFATEAQKFQTIYTAFFLSIVGLWNLLWFKNKFRIRKIVIKRVLNFFSAKSEMKSYC